MSDPHQPSSSLPDTVSALVPTPRELDKRWTRIARGDRGCAFDALSLLGALLTVLSFALARSKVLPIGIAYGCVALWVLGFGLGARAQLRSGKRRKTALREGQLLAMGVIEAEAQLAPKQGKPRVGKALVVLVADDAPPRDAERVAKLAVQLNKERLAQGWGDALQALYDDPFCFARVPLKESSGEYWVTRIVVYPERLPADAGPVGVGSVLWGIDDAELDFLEQVIASY